MSLPAAMPDASARILPGLRAWNGAGGNRAQEDQDGLLWLAAPALLRESRETVRTRRLIAQLMTRGLLASVCRRIAAADPGAAAGLLLIASRIDSRMADSLADDGSQPPAACVTPDQWAPLMEAVALLAELGCGPEAPLQDARFRASLARVWDGLSRLARLAGSFFEDPDPRVRANAVESLWGRTDEDAVRRFRAALGDSHPRPVANACVGLYLSGRAEAVRELSNLASHPEPRFRAAAAWAMGRTGHSRFLPLLAEMRAASSGPVSLLKCIVQAKETILAARKLPRTELLLEAAAGPKAGELAVSVQPGDSGRLPVLQRRSLGHRTQWSTGLGLRRRARRHDRPGRTPDLAAHCARSGRRQDWPGSRQRRDGHPLGPHRVVAALESPQAGPWPQRPAPLLPVTGNQPLPFRHLRRNACRPVRDCWCGDKNLWPESPRCGPDSLE